MILLGISPVREVSVWEEGLIVVSQKWVPFPTAFPTFSTGPKR